MAVYFSVNYLEWIFVFVVLICGSYGEIGLHIGSGLNTKGHFECGNVVKNGAVLSRDIIVPGIVKKLYYCFLTINNSLAIAPQYQHSVQIHPEFQNILILDSYEEMYFETSFEGEIKNCFCESNTRKIETKCIQAGTAVIMNTIILTNGKQYGWNVTATCDDRHYGSMGDYTHLFGPAPSFLLFNVMLLEFLGVDFSFFQMSDPKKKYHFNSKRGRILGILYKMGVGNVILCLIGIFGTSVEIMAAGFYLPRKEVMIDNQALLHFLMAAYTGICGFLGMVSRLGHFQQKSMNLVIILFMLGFGGIFMVHHQYTRFEKFMHETVGVLIITGVIFKIGSEIYPKLTLIYLYFGLFASLAAFSVSDYFVVAARILRFEPEVYAFMMANLTLAWFVLLCFVAWFLSQKTVTGKQEYELHELDE